MSKYHIPMRSKERLLLMHSLLPYLSKFYNNEQIEYWRQMPFVSSRALLKFYTVTDQHQALEDEEQHLRHYCKDNVDDECRFVSKEAVRTASNLIYKDITNDPRGVIVSSLSDSAASEEDSENDELSPGPEVLLSKKE